MGKHILLPGLALAGGGLGFAVRLWQRSAGYDPSTELFIAGHPSTPMLLALTALLTAALLLLLRGEKRPTDFLSACRCPSSGYMALMAASALLFLGSGVLGLLEGMRALALWRADSTVYVVTYPAALILCAALALAAGPAILAMGKAAYRGQVAPSLSLSALLPAFAALAWLFATHLAHGTDPVLMHYGFNLGAAACLLLAHYDLAALFHGRPHPCRIIFFGLLGLFLGMTSLADRPSLFQTALTAAFALSALANSWAILHNTFGPDWPKRLLEERMPSGAAREDEDDDDDIF